MLDIKIPIHDFLIIDSGPVEAIKTCILAEADKEVLVLEKGPTAAKCNCQPFSPAEMALRYRNGGITPALGHPKIAYVEACCEGGGSEVTSGLHHRTPPEVLAKWQKEFLPDDATENRM
ncbi:MAG: hypothetical protein N2035_07125 [Chthoniobacterales bacterium]|nr:hypothetical protein [Chthoniobacterales bacterium]